MHTSVLLQETIDAIAPHKGGVYVDGTLGMGGHSEEIFKRGGTTVIGIDKDAQAIAFAQKRLSQYDLKTHEGSFKNMKEYVFKDGYKTVDGIVLDLGVSSFQLDEAKRGFSFRFDEPLLMTMKAQPSDEDVTALDAVNTLDEQQLADLIYTYGEETRSHKIAKAIVKAREHNPITTTLQLVSVIESVVPKTSFRHPATKVFQALRIYVNDELSDLREGIWEGISLLSSQARFAIITFHSLEDRIVKELFKEAVSQELGTLFLKKSIVPSDEEISSNKRSRSARLRVFQKS